MFKQMARGMIWVYKYFLSPLLGKNCKFHPSCSTYADEAIARFGVAKGGWLALKRLCRCGPFTHGGYDPVPEIKPAHNGQQQQKEKPPHAV